MAFRIGIASITGKMGAILLQYGLDNDLLAHKLPSIDNVNMGEYASVSAAFSHNTPNSSLRELLVKNNIDYYQDIAAFIRNCDLIIDFSAPELSISIAEQCQVQAKALVCGTTGFSSEQIAKLAQVSQNILCFWAPNMSIGINILKKLMLKADLMLNLSGDRLDRPFDLELIEYHHAHKRDNPSGTALMLAESLIKQEKNLLDPEEYANNSRFLNLNRCDNSAKEAKARSQREIGLSAVRGGGVFGEHEVLFMGKEEVLKLSHTALNRGIFADGAYKAAYFLRQQAPGRLYGMDDMLA